MKTDSLDCALMARYYECLHSHPGATLRPMAIQQFDFHAISEGRMVHVMVAKGKTLTVQWVDTTPSIQWLFDLYGH